MDVLKQHWIGIVGLLGLSLGIPLAPGTFQNCINIIGVFSLVCYARKGKNDFFFYLELVLLLGTLLQIAAVSPLVMWLSLIVAALLALIKIFQNLEYRVWYTGFGLVGLGGLVMGYATLNPLGYAVGGIASVFYCLIAFIRGQKSMLIFMLLNIVYGSIAIYMVLQH